MIDATFVHENIKFNYRVAALACRGTKILLQYFDDGDGFWTLPGGRCHVMENSEDATKREFFEETGHKIEILKPIWFVENFFSWNGKDFHELLIIYSVKLESGSPLDKDDEYMGNEGERKIPYKWVEIKDLDNYKILPNFLSSALKEIPSEMKHIIHYDK